jgi:hypothetical protein
MGDGCRVGEVIGGGRGEDEDTVPCMIFDIGLRPFSW